MTGTKCDFIGHFDLLTKFNEGYKHFDETKDAYLEPAITAMHKLAALGIPFEINTGAMSRGYRSAPYPSGSSVKRAVCLRRTYPYQLRQPQCRHDRIWV